MSSFDGMDLGPPLTRIYGDTYPHEATKIAGQASTRTYYRVEAPGRDPSSLIVMRLPEDAFKSDEGPGDDRPTEHPFVAVAELFARRGLRVPRIYEVDLPRRLILLEDIGDESFEARLLARSPSEWPALYAAAVDRLVEMHQRLDDVPERSLIRTRRFDQTLLRWELDHFREWGLEVPFGSLSTSARSELDATFDRLAEELATSTPGVVHRDYQSRNLHWKDDELVIIDFQDAMMGPVPYDLVALLCDSYVELPAELQTAMIARYADARGLERAAFERLFWRQAVQRKLKDAGRFVFIDRVRGNAAFLAWFGRSLRYVGRALERSPDLAPLRALLSERIPGFPDAVPAPTPDTGSAAGRA